ncbi:MAG: hypothetical protein NWE94_07535 [Candidatus Bathyarchaeota archaeon]|nr:hypothetical protein [Candidatus Bathyarchaeota archaeon]
MLTKDSEKEGRDRLNNPLQNAQFNSSKFLTVNANPPILDSLKKSIAQKV